MNYFKKIPHIILFILIKTVLFTFSNVLKYQPVLENEGYEQYLNRPIKNGWKKLKLHDVYECQYNLYYLRMPPINNMTYYDLITSLEVYCKQSYLTWSEFKENYRIELVLHSVGMFDDCLVKASEIEDTAEHGPKLIEVFKNCISIHYREDIIDGRKVHQMEKDVNSCFNHGLLSNQTTALYICIAKVEKIINERIHDKYSSSVEPISKMADSIDRKSASWYKLGFEVYMITPILELDQISNLFISFMDKFDDCLVINGHSYEIINVIKECLKNYYNSQYINDYGKNTIDQNIIEFIENNVNKCFNENLLNKKDVLYKCIGEFNNNINGQLSITKGNPVDKITYDILDILEINIVHLKKSWSVQDYIELVKEKFYRYTQLTNNDPQNLTQKVHKEKVWMNYTTLRILEINIKTFEAEHDLLNQLIQLSKQKIKKTEFSKSYENVGVNSKKKCKEFLTSISKNFYDAIQYRYKYLSIIEYGNTPDDFRIIVKTFINFLKSIDNNNKKLYKLLDENPFTEQFVQTYKNEELIPIEGEVRYISYLMRAKVQNKGIPLSLSLWVEQYEHLYPDVKKSEKKSINLWKSFDFNF